MQTLVATHRTTERHPLFDESSAYGKLRANVRPELKMKGYFCQLWSRVEQAGTETPTSSSRSEQDLDALARRLTPNVSHSGQTNGAPGAEPALRVLDALAHPVQVIVSGAAELSSPSEAAAELCLVREADASVTVGLLLRCSPPLATAPRCRAFFLPPKAAERLEAIVGRSSYLGAFAPDVLRDNVEVARILCTAVELEGKWSDETAVCFARLPVPAHYQILPPGIEQAHVVITLHFDGTPLPARPETAA